MIAKGKALSILVRREDALEEAFGSLKCRQKHMPNKKTARVIKEAEADYSATCSELIAVRQKS